MIDLAQRCEPYEVALPHGLTVIVKPLTTAGMSAAQTAARLAVEAIERQARERTEAGLALDGLPDLSADGERDGFYQSAMPRDRATASVRRQLGPASASTSLVRLEPSLHVLATGIWGECSMNRLERIAYDLGQAARVAWFYGHARLAERLAPPVVEPAEIECPLPTLQQMMGDLYELFRRDRANIEAGYYRLPPDLFGSPRAALEQSLRFLSDLGRVDRRRRERIHDEFGAARDGPVPRYPDYYVQNFHYQTDGYLSDHSAAVYDFQVEVLFKGGADAMRRQALVPIAEHLRGRPIRTQRLLDVACGTGRFLSFVKRNHPRLPVVGVDLSAAYLRRARQDLRDWSWVDLALGPAEALPFGDASFDLVTCVYLLHELPRPVRERAAAEFARVLRPGGRLVLVDSFQFGDEPAFDGLLELFPLAYHEPYFADYVRHDLGALFADLGLRPVGAERAHMSKVMTFDQP